jgi:Zn-finger nucleic acid-binding protein
VTIARPQGHDASVVRCSCCGAPRHDGASHCQFCGADFTLREQDLDTICPHCLARIGDSAKFCDHCGHPLAAEPLKIEETTLVCPKCGDDRRLNARLVQGDEVYECQSCAGIWIGADTFQQLVERASGETDHLDHRGAKPSKAATEAKAQAASRASKRAYLPCPVCQALMVRQNYAHRSGVIIDVCRKHGIWFDAEKLTRILDWARSGGLAAAREEQDALKDHEERIEGRLVRERLAGSPWLGDDQHGGHEGLELPWIVGEAIILLGRIFRH